MAGEKKLLANAPSKHDGDGYITVGGRVLPGFWIAKMDLQIETIVSDRRFLNERMTQHAARGQSCSGNVSYFHTTSALMKAMEEYKNGGDYPDITIVSWAETPQYGRCQVQLTGVILKTVPLNLLDDSGDDEITFDSEITANDYQIIESFKEAQTNG